MKRILATALVLASLITVQGQSLVAAAGEAVYIFNTKLSNNIGLEFCTPTTTKTCIDSISVNGNPVTQATSISSASHIVAGGLYTNSCRFLETTATTCEVPYMVMYPRAGVLPTDNLGTVKFVLRRKQASDQTARLGTVIANASVQTFSPAAPGVSETATIEVKPTVSQVSASGGATCIGWVFSIENCPFSEYASQQVANRVTVMVLSGMRHSVTPPDLTDPNCQNVENPATCLVNVYDPASIGGWMDTDAATFGLTTTDRFTGAAQLKIAGPHYKIQSMFPTPTENLSVFRTYLPSAFLMNGFGLTPDQANSSTLPVKRTVTGSISTPDTTYTPVSGGLQITTTGIGFSVPTMSISRVVTVKKGSAVPITTLVRAAGLWSAKRFGGVTVVVNSGLGMKRVGNKIVFAKNRYFTIKLRYKSAPKTAATRQLSVFVK